MVARLKNRGFTLLELLVVLAIVALLLTISVPRYFHSVDKAKEIVLRENLRVTRSTLDKFFADRGRYPESLQELVQERYLKDVPFDPIGQTNDSWTITPPPESYKGNVYDLHSSTAGVGLNGQPYAEY